MKGEDKEKPPEKGSRIPGRFTNDLESDLKAFDADLSKAPEFLTIEAYELILSTCLAQIAEDSSEVYAELAMRAAVRQIYASIRAQMKPGRNYSSLEPHALSLQLLELYLRAYEGLDAEGRPIPSIFGVDP